MPKLPRVLKLPQLTLCSLFWHKIRPLARSAYVYEPVRRHRSTGTLGGNGHKLKVDSYNVRILVDSTK